MGMQRLLLVIVCAISWSGCSRDARISSGAFTETFAAALRKQTPAMQVVVKGELELRITNQAGKESTAYLNNSYSEYRSAPENLDAIIAKYSTAFLEAVPTFDQDNIDRTLITPVIKDRAWLAEIRESMRARAAKETDIPENVFEPLNHELIIVYAEDSPKNLRYLSPKDLKTAGLKPEELRKLAVENLKRLLPKVAAKGGKGVFMMEADGSYEASLLLFDSIWQEKKMAIEGDFVVAVPSRDVLLVTGSADKAGIKKVRELAAGIVAEAPYHLTADLFIYRSGQFVKFEE